MPKFCTENEESVDLLMAAIKASPLLQRIDMAISKQFKYYWDTKICHCYKECNELKVSYHEKQ